MFALVLGICLATSFLLSGMEAGVFALSRLRIRQQMRAGDRRAKALYGYLEDPEKFLWTILVGNTVANLTTFSMMVMGMHGGLGATPGLFWVSVLVLVLLFYALFELFPKMLFRLYPNRMCLWMAAPFRLLDLVFGPLVAAITYFSRWIMRWSGGRRFTGRLFGNRDELRSFMQESAQGLTSEERAMINRVLDLQNRTVQEITVPMSRVVTAELETPVGELLGIWRERGFSRIPLWRSEGGVRRIGGMVGLPPLLYEETLNLHEKAGDYLQKALFLDSRMLLDVALRHMQRTGERLAVVRGPDQTELGVISLEDILRFMFGEVSL